MDVTVNSESTSHKSTNSDKQAPHVFAGAKGTQAILNKLELVCAKGSDKTARYQTGWDDEAVAKFVKEKWPVELAHIKERHVTTLRKDEYGPLYNKGANGTGTREKKAHRLDSLAKDITDIMSYLTSKNPHWRDQI